MAQHWAYLILRINRKTGESSLGIYSERNPTSLDDPENEVDVELTSAFGPTYAVARGRVESVMRGRLYFQVPVDKFISDRKDNHGNYEGHKEHEH